MRHNKASQTVIKIHDKFVKKCLDKRDHYKIIKEYYDIAPKIIEEIEKEPDSDCIFKRLFEELAQLCVHYIEERQDEKAYALYEKTVLRLKKKYLK